MAAPSSIHGGRFPVGRAPARLDFPWNNGECLFTTYFRPTLPGSYLANQERLKQNASQFETEGLLVKGRFCWEGW